MEDAMDNDTAKALVGTLGNALNIAMAAQLRLAALEDVLKENDAELYARYQKKVESLTNYKIIDMNAQSLEALHARLVQVQG
jgi:hypothetical protein